MKILLAGLAGLGLTLASMPADAAHLYRAAPCFDRVEDRADRRESRRDERIDYSRRDVREDQRDRRESRRDEAVDHCRAYLRH